METVGTPETVVKMEATMPHVHKTTGEPVPVIIIVYPLQFPGDRLEDP